MIRIAFLLPSRWKSTGSGVFTFVRCVYTQWQLFYDLRIVEYRVNTPASAQQGNAVHRRHRHQNKSMYLFKPRQQHALVFGYVRMLLAEVRRLMVLRCLLKGRIVVHNQFGAETQSIACLLLLPFGRLVAIAHTHPASIAPDRGVRGWFERLSLTCCSAVVFNSHSLKKQWEQRLGKNIKKGRVVHHGMEVPEAFVQPDSYPTKLPGTIDVVCVGVFYRWKGQLALIDAWPDVIKACSVPLRLIFVGAGACFQQAQARVKELGLEQHVVLVGQQENGADFFNGADIAIHYPVEPEAFGLVLLEAMARGKPVIAPAHGGATEIVVDGETGFLVAPEVGGRRSEGIHHKEHRERKESETEAPGYAGNSGRPQTADLFDGTTKTQRHEECRGALDTAQTEYSEGLEGRGETSSVLDPEGLKSKVQRLTSETKDRRTLVTAVCKLAEDAALRKRMGDAGRERVRTEFSVEKMLAGYDRVFREVAGKRNHEDTKTRRGC